MIDKLRKNGNSDQEIVTNQILQRLCYLISTLGISPRMSFNATTLNMAEKRTAETRSKLSPITDDATKNVQEKISEVDPGLAILPIIGKNVQFFPFFPSIP